MYTYVPLFVACCCSRHLRGIIFFPLFISCNLTTFLLSSSGERKLLKILKCQSSSRLKTKRGSSSYPDKSLGQIKNGRLWISKYWLWILQDMDMPQCGYTTMRQQIVSFHRSSLGLNVFFSVNKKMCKNSMGCNLTLSILYIYALKDGKSFPRS